MAGEVAERARDEGLAHADGGENGDARDVDDVEAQRARADRLDPAAAELLAGPRALSLAPNCAPE